MGCYTFLQKNFNKRYCCSQQFFTILIVALGIINGYLIRVSLAAVLKVIVKKPSPINITEKESFCDTLNRNISDIYHKAHKEQYDWNPRITLLASQNYFIGYMLGHLPGGYLSDRYGGKYVLAVAVGVPALMHLSLPIFIIYTEAEILVLVTRFLTGLLQGALFPAAHSMISCWTPLKKIGGSSSIVFSSTQITSLIHYNYTIKLINASWSYVCYYYGFSAVLWTVLWLVVGYSNPNVSPLISNTERDYLNNELKYHVVYKDKKFPWKKMLLSKEVWALSAAQFGHTWIQHSLVRDLPNYMYQILQIDVAHQKFFSSLPYIVLSTLIITLGYISDMVVNRKYITLDTARKICTTLGAMGPGIFILGVSFSDCIQKLGVVMFTVAMGLMSFYYAGTRVVALELAPNYSGCIMGLANGLGAVPGLIQYFILRKYSTNPSMYLWRSLFLLGLGVLTITNVIFIIFGTAAKQSWNNYSFKKVKKKSRTNS